MANEILDLINQIKITNVLLLDNNLFDTIKFNTHWDDTMLSRKTVSYGIPYNYSGIRYQVCPMPHYLHYLQDFINNHIGFFPNNCLINYYLNGESKMGFHSDQIDQLVQDTGIAIFSLGNPRIIRFRNIADKEKKIDLILNAGTLFYMSQKVQKHWMHAILPDKSNPKSERISITFRMLIGNDDY